MSEIYNKGYYENYDVGVDQVSYKDSEYTRKFLQKVAKRIVEDLNPKTVLDAGCAMGHLVTALRDLGVKAYGIDISDYAISQVREDIRPYCVAASLADPLPKGFPQKFDLVVSIEVLEHLYEEDCEKAISNLASAGDKFLMSSTSDDVKDITHLNVRQKEYWAKQLAKFGLYHNLDYDANYISPVSMLFQRMEDFPRLIEDYERHLRVLRLNLTDKLQAHSAGEQAALARINEYVKVCQNYEERLAEYAQKMSCYIKTGDEYRDLQDKYNSLTRENQELHRIAVAYQALEGSAVWKCTKPLRVLLDVVKKFLRKIKSALHLGKKGIVSIKRNGLKATWRKMRNRASRSSSFKEYMRNHAVTPEQLALERDAGFTKDITFSIIVPLYNTPKVFLDEMIESVQAQSYSKWELCLADGSGEDYAYVGEICKNYAQNDSRIKYQKLEKNLKISGNTNACMKMATGDFFVLFDHDDLLHPSALFECMKAIENEDADFIYTDELTFQDSLDGNIVIHFKSDFSPDMLRSYNYICHLTVFSAELQKKVGFFSLEHNGSQDYDMILRLTEKAQKIVHIPKVLYYWRSHSASVASDISAKPYVLEDAHRALQEHLNRVGLQGDTLDSTVPSTYRIRYKLEGNPLISILIPTMDHIDDLEICISSILAKSTYQNFEIIVIENNSKNKETFDYYRSLTKRDNRIRVVTWQGIFNYSAINNFGAKHAKGEYLILLNNDIEIITENWMEEMLMFAQRADVGAVGVKLYYPDDTVQHAGVIIGLGGVAGHSHKYYLRNDPGYFARISIVQNLSAVTAACLMIEKKKFDEIGGLDESFEVAFNDVDFCMRLRAHGYLNVFTPYAEFYHHESKSRGFEDTPEKVERFRGEIRRFKERWGKELEKGDPYYNPNLTLDYENFTIAL